MKRVRLYRAAVVLVSALIGVGGVATSAYAGYGNGGDKSGPACTASQYDHSTIAFADGGASVSFWKKDNVRCTPGDVTLVSYVAPKPQFSTPQYLFDQASSHKESSATLTVKVPDCNTQVDLFTGTEVINPITDTGNRYGDNKITWFNGGTSSCVQPAVQSITNCDGSVDLSLSNNGTLSAYPVTFQISYGSTKKSVTVDAGKATTEPIHIPADSGTITVSADRLQTTTINWSRPAACVPAATAKNDCTTVTVTVTNPAGNAAVDAEVTYNDTTKNVTVAAGASEEVTFTAAKVDSATVAFPGLKDVTPLTVPAVAGDCASPSPSDSASSSPSPSASTSASASPSASVSTSTSAGAGTSPSATVSTSPVASTGVLATTGSAASTVALGAVVLLLIGGGVFFLARRRRVKFTA